MIRRLLTDREHFERRVLLPFCVVGSSVLLAALLLQRLGVIR